MSLCYCCKYYVEDDHRDERYKSYCSEDSSSFKEVLESEHDNCSIFEDKQTNQETNNDYHTTTTRIPSHRERTNSL